MISHVTYAGGVVRALLAAGPIFLTGIIIGTHALHPEYAPKGWEIFGLVPLLMASIAVGVVLSLVPILAGSYIMAILGVSTRWTRQPGIWLMVGAALGTAMILPFADFRTSDTSFVALFAITGAICALIVRYGTRWSDDSA